MFSYEVILVSILSTNAFVFRIKQFRIKEMNNRNVSLISYVKTVSGRCLCRGSRHTGTEHVIDINCSWIQKQHKRFVSPNLINICILLLQSYILSTLELE